MGVGFGDFRNAGRTSGISEIQSVSVEILVTLSNANPCFRTWIILCVVIRFISLTYTCDILSSISPPTVFSLFSQPTTVTPLQPHFSTYSYRLLF